MEVEPHFDESRPSEQELGRSESSRKDVVSDLDYGLSATASIPDPFAVKSMVKSTDVALKTAAKSIVGSMQVLPLEKTKETYSITLQHDEDVDTLNMIFKNQNIGYIDNTLEKFLSSSMIPEEFIEKFLCKADRTFCTVQATDWMEKPTGYSLIVSDDENTTDGCHPNSLLVNDDRMSIVSGFQPYPLLDFSIESKEPVIIEIILGNGEETQNEDDSTRDVVHTFLSSELNMPMILSSFQRHAATKKSGMIVSGYRKSSRENAVENTQPINENDDRQKNSTEAKSGNNAENG
jgi:hypothetical protein